MVAPRSAWVLAVGASLLAARPCPAQTQTQPPPNPDSGSAVRIQFFGEVDKPLKPGPDLGDYLGHYGEEKPDANPGAQAASGGTLSNGKGSPNGSGVPGDRSGDGSSGSVQSKAPDRRASDSRAPTTPPASGAAAVPAPSGAGAPPLASGSSGGILGWLRGERENTPAQPRPWLGPKHRPAAAKPGQAEPPADGNAASERDISRYSLWQGLNAPMALPADKAAQATPDQAMIQGRSDYARKILGERAAATVPASDAFSAALAPPFGAVRPSPQGAAASAKARFASVDVDLAQAGDVRDAVAQLAQSAGFSADDRFPPEGLGRDHRKIRLWGWLPAEKIPAALQVRSVSRVEIQDDSVPAGASDGQASRAEMVLALRVSPAEEPAQVVTAAVTRLSLRAGFSPIRTIGIQHIPRSSDRALIVSGLVPVRNLGRVLADPAVVKVMPAPASGGFADDLPAPGSPRILQFFSYVLDQHPLLLLITLLLFAPWPGRGPLITRRFR